MVDVLEEHRAPAEPAERLRRPLEDDGGRELFDYDCRTFDFACRLTYDQHGLVLDYPRVGSRVG